jgi:hypothetical protein
MTERGIIARVRSAWKVAATRLLRRREKRAETWILVLDIEGKEVGGPYTPDGLAPEDAGKPQIRLERVCWSAVKFKGDVPEWLRDIAKDAALGGEDPEMVAAVVRAALRGELCCAREGGEEPVEGGGSEGL